jgi:hypothetical protein
MLTPTSLRCLNSDQHPWKIRGRLLSLWDMVEFSAYSFIAALALLDRLNGLAAEISDVASSSLSNLPVDVGMLSQRRRHCGEIVALFRQVLETMASHCEQLGLLSSRKYISRIGERLDEADEENPSMMDLSIPAGLGKARDMIPELRIWVMEDLTEPITVAITGDDAKYYEGPELFGADVFRFFDVVMMS